MDFNLKEIENEIKEKITKDIIGNMYECTDFPVELVDKPLSLINDLIVEKTNCLNIDVEIEDFSNILMVSIIDPVSKAELANIIYSINRINDFKIIVKDCLVSIKPYIINNLDEVIESQNKYIEELITSTINNENNTLNENISTEYLSEDEFKELNE